MEDTRPKENVMDTPLKKIDDLKEVAEAELDMVAGGDPGLGVATAFDLGVNSGVEGALNVAHVVIATENAPQQAAASVDNASAVGNGTFTAKGPGNPSNFVGR